jgi:hypothetical protein
MRIQFQVHGDLRASLCQVFLYVAYVRTTRAPFIKTTINFCVNEYFFLRETNKS